MPRKKTTTKSSRPTARKEVVKKATRRGTPPWPHYEAWTTSRFWSFIRSALRSAYNRYPPKFEVLRMARRDSKSSNKRLKYEFQCAECKKWFPQSEVSVDHIEPAGALNSFEDLAAFVEKLFVGVEGLQVLCKADHQVKTNEERRGKKE